MSNCDCLEFRCPVHANIGVPHVRVQATSRYQIREHKSASQFLRTRLYKQLKAAHAQEGKRKGSPTNLSLQMCYHLSNGPAISAVSAIRRLHKLTRPQELQLTRPSLPSVGKSSIKG